MQFPCKTCNSTRYKIVATGSDPRLNRMAFWGGPDTPRTTALQYEIECGRGHRHLYVEELLPSIVLDRFLHGQLSGEYSTRSRQSAH